MKLDSDYDLGLIKEAKPKGRKKKETPKLPMPGPWMPSDLHNKKGVNWGIINPFPPYGPFGS
jgi:hypothetical protein